MSVAGFLEALAAKTPAPGGGAAACAVGAVAAALAGMVVSYSLGKKDLAAHQEELTRAAATLGRARGLFLELAREDAHAYALVRELSGRQADAARRTRELPAAQEACVRIPQAAMAAALDLLRLFARLGPMTNTHLASDLCIARDLALACAQSSLRNVEVNAPLLSDDAARAGELRLAREMLENARNLHAAR